MLNLEELYRALSYGELSNLSMSVSGTGTIIEEQQPKIVLFAQDGLRRLHSRFILREGMQTLQLVGNQTNYTLNPDVIKVLEVTDTQGDLIPLNDEHAPYSLFTPSPQVLRVPSRGHLLAYNIYYQADHLTLTQPDDEDTPDSEVVDTIDIPVVLESALRAFIAAKVYGNMNGQDNAAISSNHMMVYEDLCQEVIEKDLVSTSTSVTNTRFKKGGWA